LPDAWFQQENLLGDLLRAAGHLEHAGDPINLERYLPSGVWREPVAVAVGLKDRERVQAAAREAASLAAGLLCPEETRR
jgi:hypothetical protein